MHTEYRVLPITRWIVTRYQDDGLKASVSEIGSYVTENDARDVMGALRFMQSSIDAMAGKSEDGAMQADLNKIR